MTDRLYMAIAANGVVATNQGETPWGEASWDNFIRETNAAGNLIIGRRTYDVMESKHEFDLLDASVNIIVVTSTPLVDPKVVAVPSPQAAREAAHGLGAKIALWGGGPMLATSALKAGLLDEIWLDVEPIIIGNGRPLIATDFISTLHLLSANNYKDGVTLKYEVRHG
ncbi:MAG TPA: dihydrofolate reductase family protein [Candidatus Saccharimonadia bacterium]